MRHNKENASQSKLQHFGETLSKVLKWILASLLSTILAFIVGFMGWVLSHSTLPPFGGGVWKLVIIPAGVTWCGTMGCLIIIDACWTAPGRKRSSVGSYVVVALIIILLAAIAIPNFVNARFESSSVSLTVHVRVTDNETGIPIEGAAVRVANMYSENILTDKDGWCEAIGHFKASGTVDDSGKVGSAVMHLFGTMHVSAPGYHRWEESFPALLGKRYDYVHGGTIVTQRVKMTRTGQSTSAGR